jgi:hypothetical protein
MKALAFLFSICISLLLEAQTPALINSHCGSKPRDLFISSDSLKSAFVQPDSLLEIIRVDFSENCLLEVKKYPNTSTAKLTCYLEVKKRSSDPPASRYWVSSTHTFSSDSVKDIVRVLQFLKPIPDGKQLCRQQPSCMSTSMICEIKTKENYSQRTWINPEMWPDSIVQKAPLLAVLNYLENIAAPHKKRFRENLPPGSYTDGFVQILKTGKTRKNGYYEKRRLNGRLKVQGFYQNGEKTGEWCYYNKKATTRLQGQLVNGTREGTWYLVRINDEARIDGTRYRNGRVVARMTMSW